MDIISIINTLSLSDAISLGLGFIALVVSLISLIYSRMSYRGDERQRAQEDIFLEVFTTGMEKMDDKYIYATDFIIRNQLSYEKLVNELGIVLRFRETSMLGLISRSHFDIFVLPGKCALRRLTSGHSLFFLELAYLQNQSNIKAFIRDPKTKNILNVGEWTKIPTGTSKKLEAIVIVPKDMIDRANKWFHSPYEARLGIYIKDKKRIVKQEMSYSFWVLMPEKYKIKETIRAMLMYIRPHEY